ncbi:MAG TPA: winged helix-turn-helix domain-containing protein [Stellaceae bacterium]|nr:winged helix-turn-helix domain-containing protein [Stellaceae bacterium]
MDDETFIFGSFRLIPAQRTLLEDGKPMRLGSRALDILLALVERAGETIRKDDLIARTWPDTVVDEGALRVHVAALRKALGDGRAGKRYIASNPGRGYTFVAPVTHEQREPANAPLDRAAIGNLPASLTRIIGRTDTVAILAAQLPQRRFLTLVGPGGIGKTTVALAIGDAVSASYPDGVWLVGLAPVSDPGLVPSAVAGVLGLKLGGNEISAEVVARAVEGKKLLLILDNCEHVVSAAAVLAEALLRTAPGIHLLATSREPLRAEGERLHRLASLDLPPEAAELSAARALEHSAVQLFNERATAAVDSFILDDANVAPVLEICRRLDGLPLALELAAVQVDALGVRGVAAQLDDRFALLTKGRRTALPRHQTLRAMMDWSYDLLAPTEQVILQRLAAFRGAFTIDAAIAVAMNQRITAADAIEGIANLAAKSLISTDLSGDVASHLMLDTTRSYALEKLAESGERAETARRHAEYHRDLFRRARREWESRATAAWLAEYGHRLDDLRAALDWAYSPGGDAELGVMLTVDAVPLWLQFSLMSECRRRVEQALTYVATEADQHARLRMRLATALSLSRMYSRDPLREIHAAWSMTLGLAERVGDADYQLRAIWGLFAESINSGNFRAALAHGEQFRNLATEATDRLIGERLIGTAQHFLGDQRCARQHIEHMLANYTTPVSSTHIIRFQNDQVVAARRVLALILWLQGLPDQAMQMVEQAIADAVAINHALTLCNLLAQSACPLALLTGAFGLADRFTTMLIEHANRHSLDIWHAYGRCFQGILLIKRGDFDRGLTRLREAGGELRQAGFTQYYTPYLSALAEGLGGAGRVAAALEAIDDGLARAQRTEEHWCLAELWRIKGELVISEDAAGAAVAAEGCFLRSLDWSRRQRALSWELRTAISLARLWRGQRLVAEAKELLGSVYDRFTEGFATADLQEAKQLLQELA